MKLIFEMIDGTPYLYGESNKHHKIVEPKRAGDSKKIDPKVLEHNCAVEAHGSNFYMVFDLKKKVRC